MSKNEIFAPNGPNNKMSLPVESKKNSEVVSGSPVKVGVIVGVAQTSFEDKDGGTTGVVNSNAPGNVTVWNGGVWRLPVKLNSSGAIGDVVHAAASNGTSLVKLSDTAVGGFPFGVLREASGSGTDLPLAVAVYETTAAAVAV